MMVIEARRALLPEGWAEHVRVAITPDGRIGRVETGHSVNNNKILLPAPANLHSHAFQRAMAGMTEQATDDRDSFWTWRTVMYRFVERLTPEQIEAISALAYAEMMEAGYAAVAEFHYLHHQPGGRAYDTLAETSERIIRAAVATGIGLTHLPVLYSYGGADRRELEGGQRRFGNDLERFFRLAEEAERAIGRTAASDMASGVALHSLRATSPDQIEALSEQFRTCPIHMHIAEQTQEVEEIEGLYGQRPVPWLLHNAPIDRRWCLIHATHMDEGETERLARSGAVAGLCPITEANLGDGIFNGAAFTQSGGRFGIGSDSHIRIALAEELRTLEYGQRLKHRRRNVMAAGGGSTGEAIYRAALRGGAQALSRDAGSIVPGKLADLVALDGDHLAFSALETDQLIDGWLFAGDDRVVTDVWAAGRHQVRHGRHIGRDAIEERYRQTLRKLVAELD